MSAATAFRNGFAISGLLFVIFILLCILLVLARSLWRRCRDRLRVLSPRYLRRLAWYKLTRRMPGRCPRQDLCRLDPDDAITWGKLTTLIKQRGIYADDPQRDRRLP